jgi:hypothetical protein
MKKLILVAFVFLGLSPLGFSQSSPAAPLKNEVVLLWPRIIPSENAKTFQAEALGLQARLKQTLQKILPGFGIDVRPEGERSCGPEGCRTLTVGVLLLHKSNGCVTVAMVHRPGKSAARLVPWAGTLQMKAYEISYGEKPENYVSIKDFIPCDLLLKSLDVNEDSIEKEIRRAAMAEPR